MLIHSVSWFSFATFLVLSCWATYLLWFQVAAFLSCLTIFPCSALLPTKAFSIGWSTSWVLTLTSPWAFDNFSFINIFPCPLNNPPVAFAPSISFFKFIAAVLFSLAFLLSFFLGFFAIKSSSSFSLLKLFGSLSLSADWSLIISSAYSCSVADFLTFNPVSLDISSALALSASYIISFILALALL